MSTAPTRQPRNVVKSDHEHVGKISTQTTMFVLIVVAIILYEIQWILLPFVLSGLLAYICTPAVEWLAARSRTPRWLSALMVFLALLLSGAWVAFLGVPPLIRELTRIVTDFQNIIESLASGLIGDTTVKAFGQSMNATQLAQSTVTGVTNWIGQTGRIVTLTGAAFATVFGLFLTLVLLAYFLLNGPQIARRLLWLVPPNQRPLIQHLLSLLNPVLKRYFVGVIIVVAYATTAAYLGLGIALHMPHALVLAVLTGILEMIPMIGPGLAAVLVGLVALRYATGIGAVIGYAIYAAALRLSIDQFFGPLALGGAARLHPVLIIFCFLAGGLLFGVVGVIMSVPVALTVKVTLGILYDEPMEAGQVEHKAKR